MAVPDNCVMLLVGSSSRCNASLYHSAPCGGFIIIFLVKAEAVANIANGTDATVEALVQRPHAISVWLLLLLR